MNLKLKLIERLVEELPEDKKITTDEARISWFHNIRRDGGMRLSDSGFEVLSCVLRLEYHEIIVDDPLTITTRVLIDMDRRLTRPYYVFMKKRMVHSVAFFDDGEAVAAVMYGDLARFIANYT